MRKKESRFIIVFPSTTAAMALQSACEKEGLSGRLIPLPPQIRAGCGLAWCCRLADEEKLRAFIDTQSLEIEDFHYVDLLV
jgi:hypothetical protein